MASRYRVSSNNRLASWNCSSASPWAVSARIASVQPATITAAVNMRRNVLGITEPPRGSLGAGSRQQAAGSERDCDQGGQCRNPVTPLVRRNFHCRLPAARCRLLLEVLRVHGDIAFPLLRRFVEGEN